MSINLVGGGSWNGKAKIAPNAHPLGTLNDFGEVVGVVVKWNGLGGTLKRGRNPYHQLDGIARSGDLTVALLAGSNSREIRP